MEQAVILAGGLGKRLRPLTDITPKPLVPVADKPFISHVINDLKCRGFKNFILLTGYRSDLISEYFKEDQSVICVYSPKEFTKSERLKSAQHYLNNEFLLLYSDNFIPEDIGDFDLGRYDLKFTLTKKNPGNFEFSLGSDNLDYDPERKSHLNFVELGYTSVNKNALFKSLDNVESLEEAFSVAISNNRASARVIQGPYFSVSDPSRLQITQNAIEGQKIILIDRDGVINKRMPKGKYVTEIAKCEFLEDNLSGMKGLSEKGFTFVILSNQAGVARGHMNESQLNEVNDYILQKMADSGISILDLFICTHNWDENCHCRKPKPGMLLEAARKYNLYLKKTVFIGDDERDVEAALAANSIPIYIGAKKDLNDLQSSVKAFANVTLAMEELVTIYKGSK